MNSKLLKKMLLSTAVVSAVCCTAADSVEDSLAHECTSWMVFSDLTRGNFNILHKSRDSKTRRTAVLRSKSDSGRKWVGMGETLPTEIAVCMGMNASGLACVVNSGEKCIDNNTDPKAKGTPAILQHVLENCDTAAQAVEELKKLLKAKDYWHGDKGSIFLFCDTKEGYICENTANFISVQRYERGYALRANNWYNPGMAQLADNFATAYMYNSIRQYVVLTKLNEAVRRRGKVTVQDCLDLTRVCKNPPSRLDLPRSICHKHTNSASSLVIDQEYPDVLSTAWLCIGPPRNTVCVPVPICVEKCHPAMEDLRFSGTAWKKQKVRSYSAQLLPEFTAFEKMAFEQYAQAQLKAKDLLKKGQKKQAIEVLNTQAAKLWSEAAKVLEIPEK